MNSLYARLIFLIPIVAYLFLGTFNNSKHTNIVAWWISTSDICYVQAQPTSETTAGRLSLSSSFSVLCASVGHPGAHPSGNTHSGPYTGSSTYIDQHDPLWAQLWLTCGGHSEPYSTAWVSPDHCWGDNTNKTIYVQHVRIIISENDICNHCKGFKVNTLIL